jgi:5'-nucleotidase
MLTIAISSRSLFHIEDGNHIFETEGQDAFDAYMREQENTPLRPGTAFHLVQKLLALNHLRDPALGKGVEVVMLSRNSPDAGMRAMNSVEHYGLNLERAVFCSGADRFRYAKALQAHLFLSANAKDVKDAIDGGIAAATLVPSEGAEKLSNNEVRIAFDGDSVLFSAEADECYRKNGLDAFRQHEIEKAGTPLGAGPFKNLLRELHVLQQTLPQLNSPLRIALVTARGMPAHARVLHTLRAWGIRLDEAIFAAGAPKGQLLQAFGADIFFDDTPKNVSSGLEYDILSGHVPFGEGGIVASPLVERTLPAA